MATEPTRPLGILAGGGTLPRRVAEAAAAQGRPVFIVAFTGQFDPATVVGFPHISLKIGEAGRILAEMRKAGVVDLVMAGGVSDVMNCGYGQGYSVLNVLRTAGALVGKSLNYTLGPRRAGDPAEVIADASRIRARLDWTPRRDDLELILRTAIAWENSLEAVAA